MSYPKMIKKSESEKFLKTREVKNRRNFQKFPGFLKIEISKFLIFYFKCFISKFDQNDKFHTFVDCEAVRILEEPANSSFFAQEGEELDDMSCGTTWFLHHVSFWLAAS